MPIRLFPPKTGRTPYWHIRGTYLGTYVNRSSCSGKREIAVKLKRQIEDEIERGAYARPGDPTFKSAALAYMQAGGERTYLPKLLEHFGETPLKQIDQSAIDGAAITLYPNATSATRNRQVHTPCSAVLREAGALLSLRRPRGSVGNKQTHWLWPEQAERLFEEASKLNPNFEALLIVLTYTGMRLSEALKLEWNNVRLEDGFAYVADTKNSEPRAVFLPPMAVAALANLDVRERGRPFRYAKGGHIYSLLRTAAFKAGVDLPLRSAFHILRHTYATWMRRYGGLDTRGLVGTGAWKDMKSAERYAHVVVTEEAQRAALLPTPKKRKA
jgi:integrase